MHRRIVVTGMGVLSAIGTDLSEYWQSLAAGKSGILPLSEAEGGSCRIPNAAKVPYFDPGAYFDRKHSEQMDRFAQFGLIAARQAVQQAGWERNLYLPERIGVITGNCCGGQYATDDAHRSFYKQEGHASVYTIPRCMGSAGASHIAMEFGITGPSFTLTTACASSAHAIGHAFWMLRAGLLDAVITGGSEASLTKVNLKAWEKIRVVSQDICRPFSRNRSGTSLGEGAAMLTLETLEGATARSATIYGEILGFGMSSDAQHLTQPSDVGMVQAMRSALQDAQIPPQQIGYINAHGSGTCLNDAAESRAIQTVFESHVDALPVSGTKSLHGHALGAAASLEAVATILALREGILPPTAYFTEQSPDCSLRIVVNQAHPAQAEVALSNSFAFGGLNASLVFKRWPTW